LTAGCPVPALAILESLYSRLLYTPSTPSRTRARTAK